MMDADASKIEVVIVQKQTINVREDAIERLARLLCKADGNNPDDEYEGIIMTSLTCVTVCPDIKQCLADGGCAQVGKPIVTIVEPREAALSPPDDRFGWAEYPPHFPQASTGAKA